MSDSAESIQHDGRWYSDDLQWAVIVAGTIVPGFVAWYGATQAAPPIQIGVVTALSALAVFSGAGVWVTAGGEADA